MHKMVFITQLGNFLANGPLSSHFLNFFYELKKKKKRSASILVHCLLLAQHTPRKSVTSLPNPVMVPTILLLLQNVLQFYLWPAFFPHCLVGSSTLFFCISNESQQHEAQPSKFQSFTAYCALYMPPWKFFRYHI